MTGKVLLLTIGGWVVAGVLVWGLTKLFRSKYDV